MHIWSFFAAVSWEPVLYAVLVLVNSVGLIILIQLQCASKKKNTETAAKPKPVPVKQPPAAKPAEPAANTNAPAPGTGCTDNTEDPDLKSKTDYHVKTEQDAPQSACAPVAGDKFVAKGGGIFVDKDGNPISQHALPNDARN